MAFEHYLNPDVITSLLDSPEGLKLGGEKRHLAILFADIVSFTKRAEKTDARGSARAAEHLHDLDDRRDFQDRRRGGQVDGRRNHGVLGRAQRSRKSVAIGDRLRAQDAREPARAANQRSALRGSRHRHRHFDRRRRGRQPRRRKPVRLFRHRRHRQFCVAARGTHPPFQGASAGQSPDLQRSGRRLHRARARAGEGQGKRALRADRPRRRTRERQRRSFVLSTTSPTRSR